MLCAIHWRSRNLKRLKRQIIWMSTSWALAALPSRLRSQLQSLLPRCAVAPSCWPISGGVYMRWERSWGTRSEWRSSARRLVGRRSVWISETRAGARSAYVHLCNIFDFSAFHQLFNKNLNGSMWDARLILLALIAGVSTSSDISAYFKISSSQIAKNKSVDVDDSPSLAPIANGDEEKGQDKEDDLAPGGVLACIQSRNRYVRVIPGFHV